jgi:hypothetical protein
MDSVGPFRIYFGTAGTFSAKVPGGGKKFLWQGPHHNLTFSAVQSFVSTIKTNG